MTYLMHGVISYNVHKNINSPVTSLQLNQCMIDKLHYSEKITQLASVTQLAIIEAALKQHKQMKIKK